MGDFANEVQECLRSNLDTAVESHDWRTEYRIAGTPVDVAGQSDDEIVLVELEWRRADPADNTAKLFRHLSTDQIDADRVHVFQLFTNYYDLQRGGVSSKRQNAEFVGETAAETFDHLTYLPMDLELDPPKGGTDRPGEWRETIDCIADDIAEQFSP